ncbi:MAG: hypothetical protein NZ765_03935 [Anaerolineae bacterium]|nr:hypothetical protein [Anaerolineae bacterium]
MGCNIRNADHIAEEFQHLEVEDKIYLAPQESRAPFFEVAAIYPRQALVLRGGGAPSDAEMYTSWTFFLAEQPDGTTRLIARYRMDDPPRGPNRVIWEGIPDPVFFIIIKWSNACCEAFGSAPKQLQDELLTPVATIPPSKIAWP